MSGGGPSAAAATSLIATIAASPAVDQLVWNDLMAAYDLGIEGVEDGSGLAGRLHRNCSKFLQ